MIFWAHRGIVWDAMKIKGNILWNILGFEAGIASKKGAVFEPGSERSAREMWEKRNDTFSF